VYSEVDASAEERKAAAPGGHAGHLDAAKIIILILE
jgi:hypothetical protein